MSIIDGARVRWREWREQVAEKKAARVRHVAADQLHGHSRFWLLNVPALATICAAIVEWYWALLFCIEATGHIDWNWDTAFGSGQPFASTWNFSFEAHLVVLIGLIAATAPIVMISMIWLPVQFAMRGYGRWRRGSMIAVGILANILVIVSGTVVMNHNRQTQVRDGLVVEQQAEQNRAGLQARYAAVEQRWRTLTDSSNTTLQAQAARAGVAGWDSYIATARQQVEQGTITPARLALIERAHGSAVAAEEYVRQMDELTVQIASAPTQAAVAANVEDTVGAGLNTFAQQVEVWRPPFIAVLCTLIGIFGAWWTLAMLEHMNPRDVLRSGWAPEDMRIEDKRAEAPIPSQPMKPPREVVTDAETGEEMVKVQPKAYWRRRKGQPQRMEVQPDIPPDERGVETDGGARTAVSVGAQNEPQQPSETPAAAEDNGRSDEPAHDASRGIAQQEAGEGGSYAQDVHQDTPPELSDAELAAIDAELAEQPAEQQPEAAEPQDAVEQDDADAGQRTTPETDPKRMIAAE